MSDVRLADALSRIDAALTRVEAVAARAPSPEGSAEMERLRDSHRRLRQTVQGAIARIDDLFAGEEPA